MVLIGKIAGVLAKTVIPTELVAGLSVKSVASAIVNMYIPGQIKAGIGATKSYQGLKSYMISQGFSTTGMRKGDFLKLYKIANTKGVNYLKWELRDRTKDSLVRYGDKSKSKLAARYLYRPTVTIYDVHNGVYLTDHTSIFSDIRLRESEVKALVHQQYQNNLYWGDLEISKIVVNPYTRDGVTRYPRN